MHFRPYPILTLVAIPALALLIWLGVWQAQRAQWKAGLIAEFERTAAADPATLDDVLCGQDQDKTGKVVKIGEVRGLQVRVFGQNSAGQSGWRQYQAVRPSCYSSTGGVLAETGFEPLQIGEAPFQAPAQPAAYTDRFVVEAWPKKPFMAAANSPGKNEWHWFDGSAMSEFLQAGPVDQRYILERLEGLPAYLTRTPPAGHIGYAVTWFGMAIAFVVIYALFHARAGRLRFRKPPPTDT
jgi:surfeit locus 1 family protein